MVWLVQVRQNLTACDTIFRGRSTQRTLAEYVFETENEAMVFYNAQKTATRFAGVAGQYVTFPTFHEEYKTHSHFCDECGEGFSLPEPREDNPADEGHLGYSDLPNGNFCSRACFRSSFQKERNVYGEDVYEEDNYADEY